MAGVSLWQFALQMWKSPQIEAGSLRLQDSFGISVCLLLAGLWLGKRQLNPDSGLAEKLRDQAEHWESECVRPLRQLRRLAAGQSQWADWKHSLQDAELEAERLLLVEMERLVDDYPLSDTDTESGHAWLLLLFPQSASCQGISEEISQLLTLVQDREL